VSPTARTLEHLRQAGYSLVEVVEHWIPRARLRRDLFGCFDVLAVGSDVIGVQVTTGSHVADRARKLTASPALPILKGAGIKVRVHGWRKLRGQWRLREIEL
jgi:hypothetical protein